MGKPITGPTPATYRIPDTGSGWIDFDPTEGGQIIIPVVLNGEAVRALLDTGFDQLVVSKAFVEAHHLPLTPWAKPVSFGGTTEFYTTPAVSLDIGAIQTTAAGSVTVADLGRLSGSSLPDFDVIIGLPLLGILEWQVDQDHHRVRMLKSGTIPIADGIAVRVGPDNSRLVTDVEINGRQVTPTMIDTGSDEQISVPPPIARAIDFNAQTDMEAIGVGGSVIQPLGTLTNFRIGTRSIKGAYATVGGSGWYYNQAIKALIGMDLLRRYNMTVDLPAGRMGLASRITVPAPMGKSTSGVQGPYRDGRLTITHVMMNSPAAAVGLKAGDEICAIDGKPMSQEMIDHHWGRAAPGTRYSLKLCNGSLHIITLRSFY